MLKILILLLILSSCSNQNPEVPVGENLTDEATDLSESEEEVTEKTWTKEDAEANKDKDIESLLASEDSAPYYIEVEIGEDPNRIVKDEVVLNIDNTHDFNRGDLVKLWGKLKNESQEENEDNSISFEIIDSELVEEFKGVFLPEGSHIIGQAIPEGRYEITASNLGNIRIYDDYDEVCDEILGGDGKEGVSKLYINLIDGYTIDIRDIESTKFTPHEKRQVLDILATGFWQVPTDIKPGEYKIKSVTDQAGTIFILDQYGEIKLDHGLGNTSESPEPTIFLEEGDIILIQKMDSVKFEPTVNKAE